MRCIEAMLIATAVVVAAGGHAVAQDAGDAAKGEQVFDQCKACHALDHAVVGPPLGGIIGRKAGSTEGYSYSPLMTAAGDAGLVWSQPMLVGYLVNPTEFLTKFIKDKGKQAPGSSKMIFKLADEQSRRDVAAYLATTQR